MNEQDPNYRPLEGLGKSFGYSLTTMVSSAAAAAAATEATGPLGGLAAGIFGLPALGGVGGVSWQAQAVGTLLGVAWAVVAGTVVYGLLKWTMGLRLSPEEEYEGADLTIHKTSATPEREASW
jgi:ammonia channel protein AmtB